MTRYEYWVSTSAGREWFKDLREANNAAQDAANNLGVAVARHDLNGGVSLFPPATPAVGATPTSPKQTCIECGHVANVQSDCSMWCCRECERIQPTRCARTHLTEGVRP